jgi:clan AA aspartic protease
MTMLGSVNNHAEAFIGVDFIDANDASTTIEVMVDTGFDQFICLPPAAIAQLQLPRLLDQRVVFADGTISVRSTFLGSLMWHGSPRPVVIVELDAHPLLGMSILAGSRLTVDAVPGGNVVIEELP